MQVDKIRKKTTIVMSNGQKRDVNFFLRQHSGSHSGSETVFDVVNSQSSFIPLEDNITKDVLIIAKNQLMIVELSDREYFLKIHPHTVQLQVEMVNHESIDGEVFIDMPQSRSRLSDYFNILYQFVCIYRDQGDLILNKDYILTVREK